MHKFEIVSSLCVVLLTLETPPPLEKNKHFSTFYYFFLKNVKLVTLVCSLILPQSVLFCNFHLVLIMLPLGTSSGSQEILFHFRTEVRRSDLKTFKG